MARARLVHVDQYYLRADTIVAANAALIAAQAEVPIVKFRAECRARPSARGARDLVVDGVEPSDAALEPEVLR